MLRYVLDTNIVIEVLRHKPEKLRMQFAAHQGRLAVSSVTVMELYFGAAAASHAGEVRATLGARGEPIGSYDVLIAGHARALGLTVVTNNVREFGRVDGLRVEDWLA